MKLNAKSSPIPREQGTTVDAVAVAVAAVVYHNRLYFKLRTVAIFVVVAAAAHDFMSFDKNFLFSLLNFWMDYYYLDERANNEANGLFIVDSTSHKNANRISYSAIDSRTFATIPFAFKIKSYTKTAQLKQ